MKTNLTKQFLVCMSYVLVIISYDDIKTQENLRQVHNKQNTTCDNDTVQTCNRENKVY